MAKPLYNEAEYYEKIKKENIKINPAIWEMIDHYIGNDVYAILMIVGSHIIGDDPEDIPAEDGKKLIAHCEGIKKFLEKLKKATK